MAKKAKKAAKAGSKAKPVAHKPHEDDHIDACDLEFLDSDATDDADLPPAKGGCEEVRACRRR